MVLCIEINHVYFKKGDGMNKKELQKKRTMVYFIDATDEILRKKVCGI